MAAGLLLMGAALWKGYVVGVSVSGWWPYIRRAYSLEAVVTGDPRAARMRAEIEKKLWPYLQRELRTPAAALLGGAVLVLSGVRLWAWRPRYCMDWGRVPREYSCRG